MYKTYAQRKIAETYQNVKVVFLKSKTIMHVIFFICWYQQNFS